MQNWGHCFASERFQHLDDGSNNENDNFYYGERQRLIDDCLAYYHPAGGGSAANAVLLFLQKTMGPHGIMALVYLIFGILVLVGWWVHQRQNYRPTPAPTEDVRQQRRRFLLQEETNVQQTKLQIMKQQQNVHREKPIQNSKIEQINTGTSSGNDMMICHPVTSNNQPTSLESQLQSQSRRLSGSAAPTSAQQRASSSQEMLAASRYYANPDALLMVCPTSYFGGVDTHVLYIPNLMGSERIACLLKSIVREFWPIMQRRGYRVLSIAEQSCCTDAYEVATKGIQPVSDNLPLGGKRKRIQKLLGANNAQEKDCLGYNSRAFWSDGTVECRIFVRMRRYSNHHHLYDYKEIVNTVAHELAHCIYGDHSAKFYQLMQEILREHNEICLFGNVHEGIPVEEQFGYNIYGR